MQIAYDMNTVTLRSHRCQIVIIVLRLQYQYKL